MSTYLLNTTTALTAVERNEDRISASDSADNDFGERVRVSPVAIRTKPDEVPFLSDDHGQSWRRSAKLTTDASDECEAVECADGVVYMNLRSRQGRRCRAVAWSHNGGEQWSAVEYDPTLPELSCQGSIVRYDVGRVLLAHPSHREQRSHLTVRLSNDECRTWPVARVLESAFAAYSDLAVTANGQILCFYEAADYQQLVLARFDLSWLEQQA